MREQLGEFRLTAMCRVLGVNRSGYYAWAGNSGGPRRGEVDRLRELIKQAWLTSGTVYGYRKITRELREKGERCSRHRVRRLMKAEGVRAEVGYGTKPRHRSGPPGVVEIVVNRDFSPAAPNRVWVTDISTSAPTRAGFSWQ
jgi:putative transposase